MVDKYLIGDVNRISPEAPVPVVEIRNEENRLGGAGNVANNLRGLGAQAYAITCIGKDTEGSWLTAELQKRGVNCQGVCFSENRRTTSKTRVVSRNQQFLRLDREDILPPAPELLRWIDEEAETVLRGASALIISDYGKGTVDANTAQKLIQAANSANVPVIIDPKGDDYKKYRGGTLCTPNFKEFRQVVKAGDGPLSEEWIHAAGLKLCRDLDFRYLLITRSEQGISLIDAVDGSKKDFPVHALEVVDVTGAGDTVIAAIACGMSWGMNIDDCCRYANLAASIVISRFGTAAITISDNENELHKVSAEKIVDYENAESLAEKLHSLGKKIVFTNGCFDLLHAGHVSSITQAKNMGDVLIIGLNSDASVRRIKGNERPIVNQENRARMLEALAVVDYVIIFDEDTPEKLIQKIRPDVLVKGIDWRGKKVAGEDVVLPGGGRIEFLDLVPGLSTTEIIERIRSLS
jgi:D-beta-D-heptose 7-phosphate kinase/D-beta-D-heptose 1-phosphate adenosyltransferase